MWMEWSIPIQKLEVGKVHTAALQQSAKPLSPLNYQDGPFVLQHLNILLPPLPVKEYEAQTGKLVLNLGEHTTTAAKLLALQDFLLSSVYHQQRGLFPDSNRTRDQSQTLFQPFLESQSLYLYCPLQNQEKKHFLNIWKHGEWKRLTEPELIQKGDMIRVALRMQGISYQMNPHTNSWTGRFRVQHRILCMYHSGQPKPLLHLLKNGDADRHDGKENVKSH